MGIWIHETTVRLTVLFVPRRHDDVKFYTVILKDSYTLTPNLNMKKWF